MESYNFVLPSHGNPIVLDWIKEGKAVFQPGPLETPCLVWQKWKNKDGYGQIRLHGKSKLTHRISILAPAGILAIHACDAPYCVNPYHLRPGTSIDNMADKKTRKRGIKIGIKPRCACGLSVNGKSKDCIDCQAVRLNKPLCACGNGRRVDHKGVCNACRVRLSKRNPEAFK